MDITHNITAVLAAPNYSATYQKRISNIPNIRLIIKLLNFRLYSNTSRPDYACPAFRSISCDNASAFSLTAAHDQRQAAIFGDDPAVYHHQLRRPAITYRAQQTGRVVTGARQFKSDALIIKRSAAFPGSRLPMSSRPNRAALLAASLRRS